MEKTKYTRFIKYSLWPMSMLICVTFHFYANKFGYEKYSILNAIQAMTGNFLIDSTIDFIITLPLIFIILLVIFYLKKYKKFKEGFLFSIVILYFFLAIISFTAAYFGQFQGIRFSVGFGLLCSLFSVIVHFHSNNLLIKNITFFSAMMVSIIGVLTPLNLYINGISWSHFAD